MQRNGWELKSSTVCYKRVDRDNVREYFFYKFLLNEFNRAWI
jgi:hypothetical protein